MAEVQQDGGGGKKGGKSKQKKISTRVDFTPMVDMNMLLLTFFMFCTTLSKPQTMEIAMPPKEVDDKKTETEKPQVIDELLVNLVLDGDNKVYYYIGNPKYDDPNSLIETNYSPEGLRAFLLGHNNRIVEQINELKAKLLNKEITQEQYKEQSSKIKKETKETSIVLIKPTEASSYKNLIDALDEMQIANIARYAIIDTTENEGFLLKNKLSGGEFSKAAKAEGKL